MYYTKYLKYKQKYANLKKNVINQVGGSRTILFTFNDDYTTVYQYIINTPEDNFDVFKSRILNDSHQCYILDNSIPITDAGYFNSLPPFTVLNICTPLDNIKPIRDMLYNIPELNLDGDGTPVRRTLSHESAGNLTQYTRNKSLNIFLYDVIFSQIDFYYKTPVNNYVKHLANYYTKAETDTQISTALIY